jgi:heme A synthase
MMFFEFINSLRYPFPSGMDPNNIEHVKAFLSTLPSEAYTFIVLGWIFGSFLGGYVVSMLTKEKTYTYSFLIGTLYFSIGAIYNFFIGNTLSFALMTLPVFFIFTYLGHRTAQGK